MLPSFFPTRFGIPLQLPILCGMAFIASTHALSAQSPDVGGTQTGTLDDTNSDGTASPGERIDYDIRLSNSGGAATNVRIQDTIDPNTTLVPGSVMIGPIGVDDTYAVTGNIAISVPANAGVLVNDLDPDGGASPVLTVSSFDASSTQGGTVNVSTDGSFSYTPPVGFTGTDTFTYMVRDAQNLVGLSPGTVTLNVGAPVWFVNDLDGTPDDATAGTLGNPFNSAAAFAARNNGGPGNPGDGHAIFVFTGSGTTAGPFDLRASQVLLGQGVAISSATLGFPLATHSTGLPAAGTPPTLTSSGDAIGLATNNTVRGLRVGNTPTGFHAISGTGFGTLELSDFSTSGTGGVFDLSNGTINATSGITRLDSTGCESGISITNVNGSGLTVAVGTGISSFADAGVRLTACTAPVSLGALKLSTVAATTNPAAVGLFASNCASVTSTGGSLSTADAVAIDIDNTDLGLVLQSVSVDGADRGIDLLNTTGNLTVDGDGGTSPNGSGGSLANLSGNGIVLSNAANVSIRQLDMSGVAGTAVTGRNGCSNLAFRHGTYTVNTGTPAIGLHALDFGGVDGSGLASVTGTLDVENITIPNFCDTGLLVHNESGTLTATISGGTAFNDHSDVFGRFGINVESAGSAVTHLHALDTSFNLIESSAVRFEHDSSGRSQLIINGCISLDGGGPDDSGGGGITAIASGSGDFDIRIDDTEIRRFSGSGIVIDGALGTSQTLTAEIGTGALGNVIQGQHGTGASLGDGIAIQKDSGGNWDVRIVNNEVSIISSNSSLDRGIYVRNRDNSAVLNVEVRGNRLQNIDNEGFRLFSDDDLAGPLDPTTNLTFIDNIVSSSGPAGFGLRVRDQATVCANISGTQPTSPMSPPDPIQLDAGTVPGPTVSITQADPGGPPPNLSSLNSNAPVNTTGVINYSQPACPLPNIPVLPSP